MSSDDSGKPKITFSQVQEFYTSNQESIQTFALIGVFIILIFAGDVVADLITEYWPLIIGPAISWYLAKWAVDSFYSPAGCEVAVLDVANHTYRHVFIPELLFKSFNQVGNNVVYHTPAGRPLYIARSIDLEKKVIEYGWVHELDPQTVLSHEDAFVKWDKTLNDVLVENLELIDHPHIIGLGYARQTVRNHLDDLSAAIGLNGTDFKDHREAAEDVPEPIIGEEQIVTPEEENVPQQ